MPPAKHHEKGFQPAKLQSMIEPLTVRVEKLVGGLASQVGLPPTENGSTDGTGWNKASVLSLEEWVKSNHGFGVYNAKITDAQGTSMDWVFGERAPAGYSQPPLPPGAMGPMGGMQQMPQGVMGTSNVVFGAPPSSPGAAMGWASPMPNAGYQQFNPWGQQQMPPVPWGYQQQGYPQGYPVLGQGQGNDMRDKLEDEKRSRMESEARHEREKQEARHAQEMAEMRAELARMREAVTAKPADDPRLREVEERARRAEEAALRAQELARQEKIAADAERRHTEAMASMERRLEALTQQSQQAAQQGQLVPIFSMMQGVMQQQASIMQNVVQTVDRNADKQLDFLRSSQSQGSQLVSHVTGIADLYKNAVGFMIENAGGQSGIGEKVLEGIQFLGVSGQKIFDKWQSKKSKDSDTETRKREIEAQEKIHVETIRAQAALAAQGVSLNGPAAPPVPGQPVTAGAPVAAAPITPPAAPTNGAAAKAGTPERDLILFKDEHVIEQINVLRKGVSAGRFVVNNQIVPASAQHVAGFVLQAVTQVKKFELDVPAFLMFERGELDELIEALLPRTAPSFRDEVVLAIAHALKGSGQAMPDKGEPDEEEDEDEDEGGEDGEGDEVQE